MKAIRFLVLATVMAVLPLQAQAWTVKGGDVVDKGGGMLEAGVGWPGIKVGYHMGIIPNLEIAPFLTLDYGAPGGTFVAGYGTRLGNSFGALFKYQVYGANHLYISVEAAPAIVLAYPTGNFKGGKTAMGINLGLPAMTVSYKLLDDKLSLYSGLNLPIHIWFVPTGSTQTYIPILFRAGAEYAITDKFHVFLHDEFGPSFYMFKVAGVSKTWTYFGYTVEAGIGYRFY